MTWRHALTFKHNVRRTAFLTLGAVRGYNEKCSTPLIMALLLNLPDELLALVASKLELRTQYLRISHPDKPNILYRDVLSPINHGPLLLSCSRWLHVIRELTQWSGLVEELSAVLAVTPRRRADWHMYEAFAQLPDEWRDPRYEFSLLTEDCLCFPASPRWPLLRAQQQYAALLNYHLKVEARLASQIRDAATGLDQYFVDAARRLAREFPTTAMEQIVGGLRTPEMEAWCRNEAVRHAVRWLIMDGWDNHGSAFTDALDMLAGGWKVVNWGDTVIREILHEAFEDRFRSGFATCIGLTASELNGVDSDEASGVADSDEESGAVDSDDNGDDSDEDDA